MQVVQLACSVSWQPRQYVLQVTVRIMPVHARRLDHAHDNRRSFTTAQRIHQGLELHAGLSYLLSQG